VPAIMMGIAVYPGVSEPAAIVIVCERHHLRVCGSQRAHIRSREIVGTLPNAKFICHDKTPQA
jgi:hypothetical protein